jgi:hypothetical protein
MKRAVRAGRLRREAEGIHNPVADDLIAARQSFRQERQEAQEEGVEARRKKTQQKQQGRPDFVNGLQLQNDPNTKKERLRGLTDEYRRQPATRKCLSGSFCLW